VIRFVAERSEAGERVDVVLAHRSGVTRARVQRALKAGAVTVDGGSVRPSHRLAAGQVVEGELPAPEFAPPEAEDMPLEIRYSDDRVLVVAKPAGLVVHPARGHSGGTLVNALLGLGVPLAGAGSVRPGIVHRLDKDTSGLLLVARDDAAQTYLVDALRARSVERRYLALVRGRMPAASGTIEASVGRHPVKRRLMAVVDGGRPAVTHYVVLDSNERLALLDVTLETGRTHQIRVHLSHLGHPVLGDRTYGGALELGLTRPFLHAHKLSFPHPDGDRRIEVSASLPEDLSGPLAESGLTLPDLSEPP
jgi:23S rRNA pseudouridine1911/1915/1917 synthase